MVLTWPTTSSADDGWKLWISAEERESWYLSRARANAEGVEPDDPGSGKVGASEVGGVPSSTLDTTC